MNWIRNGRFTRLLLEDQKETSFTIAHEAFDKFKVFASDTSGPIPTRSVFKSFREAQDHCNSYASTILDVPIFNEADLILERSR